MKSLIGDRKTENAVLSGDMFSADKAFSLGLVDKVVQSLPDAENEVDAFLQNANSVIRKFLFWKTIINCSVTHFDS